MMRRLDHLLVRVRMRWEVEDEWRDDDHVETSWSDSKRSSPTPRLLPAQAVVPMLYHPWRKLRLFSLLGPRILLVLWKRQRRFYSCLSSIQIGPQYSQLLEPPRKIPLHQPFDSVDVGSGSDYQSCPTLESQLLARARCLQSSIVSLYSISEVPIYMISADP